MLTPKRLLLFAFSGVVILLAGSAFLAIGGGGALARQLAPYDAEYYLELDWSSDLKDWPAFRTGEEEAAYYKSLKGEYIQQFDIGALMNFTDLMSAQLVELGDKRFVFKGWGLEGSFWPMVILDTLLSQEQDTARAEFGESHGEPGSEVAWVRRNGITTLRIEADGHPRFELVVEARRFELGGIQYTFGEGRTVFYIAANGELTSVVVLDDIERPVVAWE